MNYNQLREWLSDKEHEQWMHWSKAVYQKIEDRLADMFCISPETCKIEGDFVCSQCKKIDAVLWRLDWKKNWKPYTDLDEETREFDREWADKIIDEVPFKCPVYQCGGLMEAVVREKPKDIDADIDGYDGDEQTPDLKCTNCNAVYQFKRFQSDKK